MKAIVFAGGDVKDYIPLKVYAEDASFIICADSGVHHAFEMNLIPDLVVGDMDSITSEDFMKVKNMGIKTKDYPPKKDYPDTDLALDTALEMGATEVILIGGIGDRPDHSLSNILLMVEYNKKGLNLKLVGETWEMLLIDKKTKICGKKGDLLSLIPVTPEAVNITTQGLYYPLKKETLNLGQARGISNVFTKELATIDIEKGLLLAVKLR